MKVKVDNVTFDVYTDESESSQCAPNCFVYLFCTITAYLLAYWYIHVFNISKMYNVRLKHSDQNR